MSGRYEYCFKCGDPTGRAGRGEDSIYDDADDSGPYCETCWAAHKQEQAMTAQTDRERLTELLREKFGARTGWAWSDVANALVTAGWVLPKPEAGDSEKARQVCEDLSFRYDDESIGIVAAALAAKGAQMQARVDELEKLVHIMLNADEGKLGDLMKSIIAATDFGEHGKRMIRRCAEQGRRIAAEEARADTAEAALERARQTVMFFASVIKSGEPWTQTCEDAKRAALEQRIDPAKEPDDSAGIEHWD